MIFFSFFVKNSLSSKFNNRVRIPLGCDLLLLLCEPLSLSNQGLLPPESRQSFLESYQQGSLLIPPLGIRTCPPALLCPMPRAAIFPSDVCKSLSPLGLGAPPPSPSPPPPSPGPLLAHIQVFCPTPTFSEFFKLIFQFCFLPVSSRSHFCFVIFPS